MVDIKNEIEHAVSSLGQAVVPHFHDKHLREPIPPEQRQNSSWSTLSSVSPSSSLFRLKETWESQCPSLRGLPPVSDAKGPCKQALVSHLSRRETYVDEIGLRGGMRVMLRLRSSSHSRLGSCSVITCSSSSFPLAVSNQIQNLFHTIDNEAATKVNGEGSNETDCRSKHRPNVCEVKSDLEESIFRQILVLMVKDGATSSYWRGSWKSERMRLFVAPQPFTWFFFANLWTWVFPLLTVSMFTLTLIVALLIRMLNGWGPCGNNLSFYTVIQVLWPKGFVGCLKREKKGCCCFTSESNWEMTQIQAVHSAVYSYIPDSSSLLCVCQPILNVNYLLYCTYPTNTDLSSLHKF